jgi:hypothetical protein
LAVALRPAILGVMFAIDPEAVPVFVAGIMLLHVAVDGEPVRAGITLEAFDLLMARAGYDADDDWGEVVAGDLLDRLRPAIEAHLQSKHFRIGSTEQPLIIELADLMTH